MKRSITGTLLAILTAIPLLVACGALTTARPATPVATTIPATAPATTPVATTIPATALPATPIATTIPATAPAGTTPVAATATRPISGTPRASAIPTRTVQGPRYSLTIGQTVAMPNSDLTIRFKSVTNDSRCPDSQFVVCAWNGEATVGFEVTIGTETHTILLIMPGLTKDTTQRGDNSKTHVTYKGYVIQIVSLEPQPAYTPPPVGRGTPTIPVATKTGPSEATATILVTAAP